MKTIKLENDVLMYNYLKYYNIPCVVVATKYDKVKASQKEKCERALKESLNLVPGDKMVLFSSVTKKGREEIYNTLAEYVDSQE